MSELSSVAAIIVSPLAALLGVWLSSQFTWKRVYSEKIWDRKANAYSSVLQALHEMEASLDAWMKDDMLRREASEEVIEERRLQFKQAKSQIQSVIGRELWLLDPSLKSQTQKLNDVLSDRYDSWFEYLDESLQEVRKAIEIITTMAGKQLQVSKTR